MNIGILYWALPLLAAVMSLTFAAMLWPRRYLAGARLLLIFSLAVAWWCLTEGLINMVPGLDNKLFWLGPQYFGVVSVPPLFAAFTLDYCGRLKTLKKPLTIAALCLPPLAVLILAWTNNGHHLIWESLTLEHYQGAEMIGYVHGRVFFAWVAFSYLYLILSLSLLLWQFFQSQALYRRQMVLMLIGSLAPWAGNAIYISGLSPLPNLDLTPLSFSFSIAALAIGSIRYQLVDIMPVARAMVFNNIGDGVFVIDAAGRLADLNLAAQKLIGHSARELLGQPAEEAFSPWADKVEALKDVDRGRIELVIDPKQGRGRDRQKRFFDLTISPLAGDGSRKLGRLYVVREVTEQRRAEEILKTSEAMFRNLVEGLPFPVLVFSEEQLVDYANPALERIFGFPAETIPDLKTWLALTIPLEKERAEVEKQESAWLSQGKGGMEATRDLRDDQGREHHTLVRRLTLGNNFYFIYEDLTERMAAEQAMRERAKMEGVMEMAGAACHEMNQPLQAVYGQCELAMMRLDPADALHRRLEDVLSGLETLARITAKIQAITRYETKDYDGGSTIIDINKASKKA